MQSTKTCLRQHNLNLSFLFVHCVQKHDFFNSLRKFKIVKNMYIRRDLSAYPETFPKRSLEEDTERAEEKEMRCKLSSEHQRPQFRATALITQPSVEQAFTSPHHTHMPVIEQAHANYHIFPLSLALALSFNTHTISQAHLHGD